MKSGDKIYDAESSVARDKDSGMVVRHDHVMRRDDTNIAKELTTMKVRGKRPRGRPRPRSGERVRSDLKEHPIDSKLAQN